MSLFNFLSSITTQFNGTTQLKSNRNLSDIEKEFIMVNRITTLDMMQFTMMPYHLDCTIKKYTPLQSHPFAFIDLDCQNIAVAKADMEKINAHLRTAHSLCRKIPKCIEIPIKDIVYTPNENLEYTRLMCTPYTFTGKIAKYPLSLAFTTKLEYDADTTHGELFYGQNGIVQKANICCWIARKGYFFSFKTEKNNLVISKIELTDAHGLSSIAYKRPTAQ